MKKYLAFTLLAGVVVLSAFMTLPKSQTAMPETKLGWKLGSQAYTFRLFTFAQALEKIDSCKLKYVEGFPGQTIGGGVEGKMDYHMDAATREKVKDMLKKKGMILNAYGVVSPDNEQDWKALFEFAKSMGVSTITSEPKETDLPLVSKLCDQYQINVAIHNHPNPSHYWNPDILLNAIKGQSKRIGACADIGHWVRSGLDPVECLKKLKGHVLHSHMKDLNEKGNKQAHDVVWGTGVCNIPAVIAELKAQKFKGQISVEYEYHWETSSPEVAESVSNFRKMLAK